MRQPNLPRIEPLNPDLSKAIPPGAVPAGVTADGQHQLFTLTRRMAKAVPRFDAAEERRLREALPEDVLATIENTADLMREADARGLSPNPMYRKDTRTGEPMYRINRPYIYDETLLFYLESEGNGNVALRPYLPPTAEQLAAEERAKRVAAMSEQLAEALVDAGLTPDELVARIRGGGTASGAESTVIMDYPRMYAPGRWELSDGSKMQGTKVKAEEAEAALSGDTPETFQAKADAKRDAETIPEV